MPVLFVPFIKWCKNRRGVSLKEIEVVFPEKGEWLLGKHKQQGVLHHPFAKAGFERHGLGKGRTMSQWSPERKRKQKRENDKGPSEIHLITQT